MDLSSKTELINFLKENHLYTKKQLGQNFLVDKNILEKIIQSAQIEKTDNILEIGPGLGTLTQQLCKHAKFVRSIEIDNTLIPILQRNLSAQTNLEIIEADALRYTPELQDYKIVANIPYYISSPLITHFLRTENKAKSITLLVQKEFGEKAAEKQKLNILALQIQLFGSIEYIKTINASSFFPAPKVDSAIIHIKPYIKDDPNYTTIKDGLEILKLAKRAFMNRRKMLYNTIRKQLKIDEEILTKIFYDLNIDKKDRPETLKIKTWKALTKKLII